MSANYTSEALQGWTSSPNGRGTFDILWSCSATIFLSTWSAICLNVSEPGDTVWTHLKRKIWITFVAMMGPKFLLGHALGDWQSARASVTRFWQIRQDDRRTFKHAFLADMAGFVLRTSDKVRFFLDTKRILWLLEHRVVSTAQFETKFLLDLKSIDDRNKSDVFVRTIAVAQAMWFCLNILARGVQGLAVTTLEITTINMTFSDEGARGRSCSRTPLDFANHEPWNFGLVYNYFINCFGCMRPRCWPQRKKKEMVGRRSQNDVLPVTGMAMVIGYFAGLAFMATNFIAWNFHFPTPVERLLWRISCCGLIGLSLAVPAGEWRYSIDKCRAMQRGVQKHRATLEDSCHSGEKTRWKDRLVHRFRVLAMKIRNNSPDDDPALDVSIFFAFGGIQILLVYFAFRSYILAEDIIACRALPAQAYSTVNWWAFVPHIG